MFISVAITLGAQLLISSRYKKYSEIKSSKDITGCEVAQKILKKNNIDNVYVVETKGYLSDHFDPSQNVIRLSSDVYHGNSLASIAVASHECGHAIQYKEGNKFIKLRKVIFPVVNLSSKFGYIAILIGAFSGIMDFILLGLLMLVMILFFQLITLPVEFDASRKALECLSKYNITIDDEKNGCKKVLFAAALTYVAGLLTTLIEILRIALVFLGDRD